MKHKPGMMCSCQTCLDTVNGFKDEIDHLRAENERLKAEATALKEKLAARNKVSASTIKYMW